MNKLTPEIISWAQQGVVPAALKIAAAMEESGLGAHTPPGSNNWFGIKGDGPATPTREETAAGHWYTIESGFKVFSSPQAGFAYYDWLISHGRPYAAAWQQWLASPKTPADVETLTRNISIRYATALSYAKALVSLEVEDKLFNYDRIA
jgi:flagellum-specific peptidoglycan hydrolase FlgJ